MVLNKRETQQVISLTYEKIFPKLDNFPLVITMDGTVRYVNKTAYRWMDRFMAISNSVVDLQSGCFPVL